MPSTLRHVLGISIRGFILAMELSVAIVILAIYAPCVTSDCFVERTFGSGIAGSASAVFIGGFITLIFVMLAYILRLNRKGEALLIVIYCCIKGIIAIAFLITAAGITDQLIT